MHRAVLFLLPTTLLASNVPVVPEPSTISMFAVAAAAGGVMWLRAKRKGEK